MSRTPRYPGGSETTSVVLPKGVKEKMQDLAWRRRQSVSRLVTEAIEDFLARQPVEETPEAVAVA